MSEASDPHAVLGVRADVSDAELRRAYRALIKRHHPDLNGGSRESVAHFEQVQEAYATLMRERRARQRRQAAGRRWQQAAYGTALPAQRPDRRPGEPAADGERRTEDERFSIVVDDDFDHTRAQRDGARRKKDLGERFADLFKRERPDER